MSEEKQKVAKILRLFADVISSDSCELTDDDLKPVRLALMKLLDVQVSYETISELSGKSVPNVRVWVCRNVINKSSGGVKVKLKDVERLVDGNK